MIPTSFSGSSPPTAGSLLGLANNNTSPFPPGSTAAGGGSNDNKEVYDSALLGIASLILEGRALAEDEYAVRQPDVLTQVGPGVCGGANTMADGSIGGAGRHSPKPSTSRAGNSIYQQEHHSHHHHGSGGGGGAGGSTSEALDMANYLRRKASNSPDFTQYSSFRLADNYSNSSSESAGSSVESNHSRWSQKLSQLRQESPCAQRQHMAAEQKVAVDCVRSVEPEYVALAINTEQSHDERRTSGAGDFEIIRRIALNRMNLFNSPPNSSGSSGGGIGSSGGVVDNFMCSLQSLASNTCLRVGTPIPYNPPITASTPKYGHHRLTPQNIPRFPTPQHTDLSGSSANSSSGGGTPSGWYNSGTPVAAATATTSHNKDYLLRKSSAMPTPPQSATPTNSSLSTNSSSTYDNSISGYIHDRRESPAAAVAAATSSARATPTTSRNTTTPQQGPHCDRFLRKLGLTKGDASDAEEHFCDMLYVNITCARWRAYCIKMENILARGEPICIEVYLGPVGHKILLEQWIIKVNDKQPPPTMTLPSLCSAIRSQLYFSQISAWCDLIKKADKTIYDTGRLIYTTTTTPRTSAAGDLATSTMNVNILGTSPTATSLAAAAANSGGGNNSSSGNSSSSAATSSSNANSTNRWPSPASAAPRLNIFYRIKAYDGDDNASTACFNTKPNVHNFPNVNISEKSSVSVCLKSLPRITGGIPKINPAVTATTTTTTTITPQYKATEASSSSSSSRSGTWSKMPGMTATTSPCAAAGSTTKSLTINCDNKNSKEHRHHHHHHHDHQQITQQQQQTAVFNATYSNREEGNRKIDDGPYSQFGHNPSSSLPSSSLTRNPHSDFPKQQCSTNNDSLNSLDGGDSFNNGSSVGPGDSFDLSGGSCVGFGEGDSSNSSLSTNYGNLSHREKQLLKYRKRMLRRDKKTQQQRKTNDNSVANENQNCCPAVASSQKMEQGEDDEIECCDDDNDYGDPRDEHQQLLNARSSSYHHHHHQKVTDENNPNATKGQRQQQQQQQQQLPNSFKNSIPPSGNGQQQQQHVKMISTGTQTTSPTTITTNNHANQASSPTTATSIMDSLTCSACGYEKSMICLKCNPLKSSNHRDDNDDDDANEADDDGDMLDLTSSTSRSASSSSSVSSLNSSDIIQIPRNKAELLLQAIQRTPKANKKLKVAKDLEHHNNKHQQSANESRKSSTNNKSQSGHHQNRSNNLPSTTAQLQSCQMCKRQKTQHHFQQQQLSSAQHEMNSSADNNQVVIGENNSCLNNFPPSGPAVVVGSQMNGAADQQSDEILGSDSDNEKDGGKMSAVITASVVAEDCVDNARNSVVVNGQAKEKTCDNKLIIDSYKDDCPQYGGGVEYFTTSTKLTPNIERCSLTNNNSSSSTNKSYYTQLNEKSQPNTSGIDKAQRLCYTPPMMLEYNGDNAKSSGKVMAQFKTPTASEQQLKLDTNRQQVQQQPHKQTPKPSLLQIAFNFNVGSNVIEKSNNSVVDSKIHQQHQLPSIHNPLLARRNSPKVNLTRIFCNPNEMKVSSPIPIANGGGMSSNAAISSTTTTTTCSTAMSTGSKSADIPGSDGTVAPTFSFESPTGPPPPPPSITVQKSNSAPTLPNSPSLSPRFIKASALYKRRSRHLSDRSDRSSLGSDEQFSDEDLDCGMYSPFATSPVKLRSRLSAVFGRKPILGNLEESLLQRRLVPKIEVMGFKLLLGASGGFCPTQLTIPAAAYFYELKGETLSTPYLCEIRLPRKGYSVPRCGTVQATLLNPMGTVVRMFVIPYDMRDMPALHQTFIRQRILADTGSNNTQTATLTTKTTTLNSVGSNSDIMVQNGNIETNPGDGGDNVTINSNKQQQQQHQHNNIGLNNNNISLNGSSNNNNNSNSNNVNTENEMGHFMSAENMKSLRYSIHLRFQTSRSGRLMLHTDIRLLISRRTDCDTAAAHAKGVLEAPNELITKTVMPTNPKYSARHDQTASNKI